MTRFRPCIDLHSGQVKQIVGGTLTIKTDDLKTNFVSTLPSDHFARLYRENGLTGGHVVMLGPGNEEAAKKALRAWPGGLQVAGGITDENAQYWIDAGAEKVRFFFSLSIYFRENSLITTVHLLKNICTYLYLYVRIANKSCIQVIITSYLFPGGHFTLDRLNKVLVALGNDKSKLVLDLSCRRRDSTWFVAMNRWQTITGMEITQGASCLPLPLPLYLRNRIEILIL